VDAGAGRDLDQRLERVPVAPLGRRRALQRRPSRLGRALGHGPEADQVRGLVGRQDQEGWYTRGVQLGDLNLFRLGDLGLALAYARRRPGRPALLLLAALLAAVPAEAVPDPPPVRVFVLAGQSNMGMWATVEYPAAPEDAALVLAESAIPDYPWTAPVPGATPGTVAVRNGPGLGFARRLAERGVARVGIVGCGAPGKALFRWLPGSTIYDNCLAAIRRVGLPVAGVLFYQGEADADTTDPGADPDHWGAVFGQVVASLRRDTGQPDLPVVFVRLAHTLDPHRGNWSVVQAQQDAVALERVVLVDPEPVTLQDSVHLDDASWLALGARLADAYLDLVH
jgi:hypothetical protein